MEYLLPVNIMRGSFRSDESFFEPVIIFYTETQDFCRLLRGEMENSYFGFPSPFEKEILYFEFRPMDRMMSDNSVTNFVLFSN